MRGYTSYILLGNCPRTDRAQKPRPRRGLGGTARRVVGPAGRPISATRIRAHDRGGIGAARSDGVVESLNVGDHVEGVARVAAVGADGDVDGVGARREAQPVQDVEANGGLRPVLPGPPICFARRGARSGDPDLQACCGYSG